MERKLTLFGNMFSMNDNRLVKNVVFGIVEGQNGRGRPSREWTHDIKEWCQTDGHTVSIMAQDRSERRQIVSETLDAKGHQPMERKRRRRSSLTKLTLEKTR